MESNWAMKLHYFMTMITISPAESFYNNQKHLTSAIEYVQEYNLLYVKDVMFLASSFYVHGNEYFLHEMVSSHTIPSCQFTFMKTSRNISMIKPMCNQLENPAILVFLDFETSEDTRNAFFGFCEQSKNTIWIILFSTEFNTYNSFRMAVNHLISSYSNYLPKLSLNTHVHVIAKINGISTLFDIYHPCGASQMVMKHLIDLSDENQRRDEKIIWENRKDLGQCVMRVGYLDYGILLSTFKDGKSKYGSAAAKLFEREPTMTFRAGGLTMQGIKVPLFSFLHSQLNFSIQWVYVDDNQFGAFDSVLNDWSGIVGMVKRNEIDTSIMDLGITTARSNVISYSMPVQRHSSRLFMRKPGPSVSWTTFLSVFDPAYWYMLLTFIVAFTISWILVSRRTEEENTTFKIRLLSLCSAVSTSFKAFVAFDVSGTSDSTPREYSSKRILLEL